jgi:hypothetical protein
VCVGVSIYMRQAKCLVSKCGENYMSLEKSSGIGLKKQSCGISKPLMIQERENRIGSTTVGYLESRVVTFCSDIIFQVFYLFIAVFITS